MFGNIIIYNCRLSRLCEEKEQKDREKNENRKEIREQLQKKRTE